MWSEIPIDSGIFLVFLSDSWFDRDRDRLDRGVLEGLCRINRASFLDWRLERTSGGRTNLHLLMEHSACQKANPRQIGVSGRERGESKMDLITAIKILINPRGLWAFYSRSGKRGFGSTLWSWFKSWCELQSRRFIYSSFKTHLYNLNIHICKWL